MNSGFFFWFLWRNVPNQFLSPRTVSDVRDVRPFLNAEIRGGFSLRKAAATNDRSAPRF